MYSIQLTHPFGLLVSGGTKSGKTTFVKKLLSYVEVMIDSPPENIVYFYAEYQDAFGEIQTLVPQIKFEQGLSDNILKERVTVDHLVAGSNPARRKFLL